MKEVSLKPTIEKLESLFSKFNSRFFNGTLDKPVIAVSPDCTRGAYGWCTMWKAWQDSTEDGGYYEINLCAEYLDRPFEETCCTLIHEMVHLKNLQDHVQDTSRSGTYHNRAFKKTAEATGALIVEKDVTYGWCITKLSPEGETFVKGLGEKRFSLVRPKVESKSFIKTGSSSRKYVCPSCKTIIRATRKVNVICGNCNVEFMEEE